MAAIHVSESILSSFVNPCQLSAGITVVSPVAKMGYGLFFARQSPVLNAEHDLPQCFPFAVCS